MSTFGALSGLYGDTQSIQKMYGGGSARPQQAFGASATGQQLGYTAEYGGDPYGQQVRQTIQQPVSQAQGAPDTPSPNATPGSASQPSNFSVYQTGQPSGAYAAYAPQPNKGAPAAAADASTAVQSEPSQTTLPAPPQSIPGSDPGRANGLGDAFFQWSGLTQEDVGFMAPKDAQFVQGSRPSPGQQDFNNYVSGLVQQWNKYSPIQQQAYSKQNASDPGNWVRQRTDRARQMASNDEAVKKIRQDDKERLSLEGQQKLAEDGRRAEELRGTEERRRAEELATRNKDADAAIDRRYSEAGGQADVLRRYDSTLADIADIQAEERKLREDYELQRRRLPSAGWEQQDLVSRLQESLGPLATRRSALERLQRQLLTSAGDSPLRGLMSQVTGDGLRMKRIREQQAGAM